MLAAISFETELVIQKDHIVTLFPSFVIWRVDRRLWHWSINHFKLVLGSKCHLHWAAPCMIIITRKRRLHKNYSWIISMMEIKQVQWLINGVFSRLWGGCTKMWRKIWKITHGEWRKKKRKKQRKEEERKKHNAWSWPISMSLIPCQLCNIIAWK